MQTEISGRRLTGAFVLAGMAAAAFWAGWAINLLPHSTANAIIGAAALAAPILLMFRAIQSAFVDLATLVLAAYPVAALGYVLADPAPVATLFQELRQWPVILSALGATLALSLLGAPGLRVAFARAAFVVALALSLLVLAGMSGLVQRWVMASPIHLAIVFVAALVISSQLSAIGSGLRAAEMRFIDGMIQLLPLLGFAGTILGIMRALEALPDVFSDQAGADNSALQAMLSGLGGAFETTLLGVGAAIIASFITLLLPVAED